MGYYYWSYGDFTKFMTYVSHKLIRKQWGINFLCVSAIAGASRLSSNIISYDVMLPVQFNAKLIIHYLSTRMMLLLFVVLILLLI